MKCSVPLCAIILALFLTVPGCLAAYFGSKLLHDARAAHDVALFPRETAAGRAWAVLRIVPGEDSGAALVNGTVTVRGTWRRISTMDEAAVPAGGSFAWTERQKVHQRRPQPSDFYSPFKSGGFVFCRYRAAAEGAALFDVVVLLPDGWESAASSLLERRKRPAKSPASRNLVSEAASPDPIVAVLACRRLLETEELEPQLLRNSLVSRDRVRTAAITYLALTASSNRRSASILAALRMTIQAAEDASEWDGIALGAFATTLFAPEPVAAQEAARMLRLVQERATAKGGPPDLVLAEILKVLGW